MTLQCGSLLVTCALSTLSWNSLWVPLWEVTAVQKEKAKQWDVRGAGVSGGNTDTGKRQLNSDFLWSISPLKFPLFFLAWTLFDCNFFCLFPAALQDICSFTRTGWHWLCQLLHYSTYHHCRPVWGRKKDHSVIYLLHLHSSGQVGFLQWPFEILSDHTCNSIYPEP